MSTRRVKNVDYDDDDLDYDEDYDEGSDEGQQGVSAEDKEQLRLGTIEVRRSLGPAYQVSDTEIQDKLWDTYYDIEKTVAYVKSKCEAGECDGHPADCNADKHRPRPTPAKPAQPTRKLTSPFPMLCPTNTSLHKEHALIQSFDQTYLLN